MNKAAVYPLHKHVFAVITGITFRLHLTTRQDRCKHTQLALSVNDQITQTLPGGGHRQLLTTSRAAVHADTICRG